MAKITARHYQSLMLLLLTILQKMRGVSRNRFFVFLAGKTNGAHRDFVEKLKGVGHTEVNSPEECDYVVVFCPVASRVVTDISEALNKMPADKPTVLVMMHHTFDSDHVLADSRRLVTNPDVFTVDCLFYENHFLECKRNHRAWLEVRSHLGVSFFQIFKNYIRHCWRYPSFKVVALCTLMVVTLTMFIAAKFFTSVQ